MSDVVVHDFPGKPIRFEYISSEGMRSQADLARRALDAMFLFAEGIYEPASMDVQVACCDPETGYPVSEVAPRCPFWLFRLRELPANVDVRPAWVNEEILTVDRLDSASILDSLRAPLGQDCQGQAGERVGWQEMLFRAARVRLPVSNYDSGKSTLTVRYGRGSIEHPTERVGDALWVWGPLARKTLTAPIELRLSNEGGLLTFDIWLLWSLWSDEHEEGWKHVQQALAGLSDQGWMRRL